MKKEKKDETKMDYSRVATQGNTIFLYSSIGRYYERTAEGGTVERGITDTDFLAAMSAVAAEHSEVHIRVNGIGGSTLHGTAIVAAILDSSIPVHTWNDGTAASMSAAIWLAGTHRHMAENAVLMLHTARGEVYGTPADMREAADSLDKITESLVRGIASSTGQDYDTLNDKYFRDYKDHYLTHADVQAEGWITDTDTYRSEASIPNADTLTMMLHAPWVDTGLDMHRNNITDQPRVGLIDRIRAYASHIFPTPPPPDVTAQNDEEMNIETIIASLGTLTESECAQLRTAVADLPKSETEKKIETLQATVASQATAMDALLQKVEAFGALPGATRTVPNAPDTDLPGQKIETAGDRLAKANAAMAAIADSGASVAFTMYETADAIPAKVE